MSERKLLPIKFHAKKIKKYFVLLSLREKWTMSTEKPKKFGTLLTATGTSF